MLLAEDDAGVRVVVEQMLSEAGYRVVSVANGNEAIRHLDHDPATSISPSSTSSCRAPAVSTSSATFEPTGLDVAILLTSGYSSELVRTMEGENLPLLTKPFRRDELLLRVRELLDARG